MENGTEREEYELENVLEVVEEVVGADNKHYNDYLYGVPRIGVALLMLVQG